jgi:mRNA-degrading endonuclease RelE of RelBE toxin-antitoxin system
MQVQILPKAAKGLKALTPPDRARIIRKIEQYADDPTPSTTRSPNGSKTWSTLSLQ